MSIPFTAHTIFQRALRPLRWLPLWGVALSALGCAGNVEVGEAKPAEGEAVENPEGTSDGQEPSDDGVDEPEEVDCAEADAEARAPYDAWREVGNDFGVLAGKTLTGYIEAGADLRLTIADDHTATLVVGEAAPPPEKNESYLCESGIADEFAACEAATSHPLEVGGSYPVHGATLEDSRLVIPLQQSSPWDAWCALQDPQEAEQPEHCFFSTSSGAGFSHSLEACTLDYEDVDCGWLALSMSGVCRCTSTECFAVVGGDGDLLDARLNEAEDALVGSFRGATVYLFVEE